MAGSPAARSWAVVAVVSAAAMALRLGGCGPGPDPDPGDGFDRGPLLASVGEVIEGIYADFVVSAGALGDAAQAWEAAAAGGDGAAERAAAQEAWRDAMAAWQRAELTQVGPAGAALNTIGGLDLRDEIYSWTTVNPCRVDQETLGEGYAAADYFDQNLVNSYGLDALEWLLFAPSADTICPSQVIEPADWDALGADEVARRRAAFAAVVSARVLADGTRLHAAWDPSDGDFGASLAGAGEGDSPYPDVIDAMDELFAAMFYVELETKDAKLAVPLGLRDCDGLCPEALESQFAQVSLDNVRSNLAAFRELVTGGDGVGFDDLLTHLDEGDLAADVLARTDAAIAAIDATDETAAELLASDPDVLAAIHDAVKELTDLVKGDFALVLALRIPTEASGDND